MQSYPADWENRRMVPPPSSSEDWRTSASDLGAGKLRPGQLPTVGSLPAVPSRTAAVGYLANERTMLGEAHDGYRYVRALLQALGVSA